MLSLLPAPDQQFCDSSGKPLAGGFLYFYQPGTSTPKAVYSDSTGNTPLANPVVLDSAGRASCWLNGAYKVILQDVNHVQIWSVDNVSVSPFISTFLSSEWILQTLTALTFISGTQFSCTNDLTLVFQVNRRVQAVVTAGTIYGTITASSFAPNVPVPPGTTTVTVSWDSGALDSGLSAVSVGVLSVTNPSFAVTTGEILNGAVTAAKIANASITTTQISASAGITGSQLANQTITATQIANATITQTQMANQSVGANQATALLGAWTTTLLTSGTVYGPAATDLYIIAGAIAGAGASESLTAYTDANNPPTTVIDTQWQPSNALVAASVSFVVKKGHFYKITASGNTTTFSYTNVIPLGS